MPTPTLDDLRTHAIAAIDEMAKFAKQQIEAASQTQASGMDALRAQLVERDDRIRELAASQGPDLEKEEMYLAKEALEKRINECEKNLDDLARNHILEVEGLRTIVVETQKVLENNPALKSLFP